MIVDQKQRLGEVKEFYKKAAEDLTLLKKGLMDLIALGQMMMKNKENDLWKVYNKADEKLTAWAEHALLNIKGQKCVARDINNTYRFYDRPECIEYKTQERTADRTKREYEAF